MLFSHIIIRLKFDFKEFIINYKTDSKPNLNVYGHTTLKTPVLV